VNDNFVSDEMSQAAEVIESDMHWFRGMVSFAKFVIIAALAAVGFEIGSNFLYWTADVRSKLHPYFGFFNIYSDDFQQRTNLHANNFGFIQPGSMK
jgi:hypothetical protein